MNQFDINKQPKIDTGFKVPDNYFENFSDSLMFRINQKDTKVIAIKRNQHWWSTAAAVLIVSLGIFSVYRISENRNEIDQNIIENYITNDAHFSNEEFIDLLDETDIQEMNVTSSISEADIEDFLSQNSNLEQFLNN